MDNGSGSSGTHDFPGNSITSLHDTVFGRTNEGGSTDRSTSEEKSVSDVNQNSGIHLSSSPYQDHRYDRSQQGNNASFDESVNGGSPHGEESVVSTDQERQLLILMLLAQVCALHDPTPRTFTVHVLELFERGLLDRESIRFLFDLGLVPPSGSPTNLLPFEPTQFLSESMGVPSAASPNTKSSSSIQKYSRELVPVRSSLDRASEVSAIRIHLQHNESRATGTKKRGHTSNAPADPAKKSWKVDHHPLYLSRYQREFAQVKLLAGGSFGQVFQATSKLDGRDYAVKKISFSATGYSNESVTQVIREVHCLAQCDHPNCVRYYTSWLEPSWMTGSGTAIAPNQIASKEAQRKLLTDLNHLVLSGETGNNFAKSEKSLSFDHEKFETSESSLRHRRRFSFGSGFDDSIEVLENSNFNASIQSGKSKDDSFILWARHSDHQRLHKTQPKHIPRQKAYRYQICLYIQMQLCLSMTLADWIRERNNNCQSHDHAARIGPAIDIVNQLIQGIAHVHDNDIVHRDLKPGNIFASKDGNFLIGDFGLSKLVRSANGEDAWDAGGSIENVMLPGSSVMKVEAKDAFAWAEPLTAGVGTASYAAPEQVASVKYGSEADVFSLGLIMLELVCCFDTEHERIQTFQDCRRGKLPNWLTGDFPDVASLIQRCTDKHPPNRPTAQELLSCDLIPKKIGVEVQETMEQLRGRLKEKEEELEQHKNVIAEKDRLIEQLQRQMKQISAPAAIPEQAQTSSPSNEHVAVAVAGASSGYSSDDDDY